MKNTLLGSLVISTFAFAPLAQCAEEATLSIFGDMESYTGLNGRLYDLKNSPEMEVTEVAPNGKVSSQACYEAIEDLARKGFSEKELDEYRIGDNSRDLKTLAIHSAKAELAPEAFGTPEIDPTGIAIVYRGIIEEAPEKEIRFAGWFDDAMLVLVNGKVVFYTSFQPEAIRYESEEYGKQRQAYIDAAKHFVGKGDAYGEYVELKKGDELKIVIVEIPGGGMGGTLKVQVKDEKYKEDSHGDPILHPFVAGKLSRDDKEKLEKSRIEFDLRGIPDFKFVTE